jgi:hypothetical protein
MRRKFTVLTPLVAITLGCAAFVSGPAIASTSVDAARENTASTSVGAARENTASTSADAARENQVERLPPGGDLAARAMAPSPPASLQASAPLTFDEDIAVDGWTSLTLYPNGAYNFSGHLHASGEFGYNVGVVWVATTRDGNPAFTFSERGRVHGTFEPGSRDFDFNQSGVNPAIAAAWPELSRGWRWSQRATADGSPIDLGDLAGVARDALGIAALVAALA